MAHLASPGTPPSVLRDIYKRLAEVYECRSQNAKYELAVVSGLPGNHDEWEQQTTLRLRTWEYLRDLYYALAESAEQDMAHDGHEGRGREAHEGHGG